MASGIPEADLLSFRKYLKESDGILAFLGAGLSAPSGLPTFHGKEGVWRSYIARELADENRFKEDPELIWQFYNHRRRMALDAKPNKGHYALAKLAEKNPNFITVTQNVDGLSERAGHPKSQLWRMHGSLFTIKCASKRCDYSVGEPLDLPDPEPAIPMVGTQVNPSTEDETGEQAARAIHQALDERDAAIAQQSKNGESLNISNSAVSIPDLPNCKKCEASLLRPGVIWRNEELPKNIWNSIDLFLRAPNVDLILVVGTTACYSWLDEFIEDGIAQGARVAVINKDPTHLPAEGTIPIEWIFEGDASVILPELFKDIIGEISLDHS